MEAGRSLLSQPSPPNFPRTHLRTHFSSASVSVLHDQASRAGISMPSTSIVRHFPASNVSQEQHDDNKYSYATKYEKVAQVTMNRQDVEKASLCEDNEKYEFDQYLKHFERRLLYNPVVCYPFIENTKENLFLAMSTEPQVTDDVLLDEVAMLVEQSSALAKRAMLASENAASLAEKATNLVAEFDDLAPERTAKRTLLDEVTVRSNRLMERRLKKRKVPKKPKKLVDETTSLVSTDLKKKMDRSLDQNDPLRLFLWGPETRQLLTVKEEKDLFVQIQDLMRLEEVKHRLQVQFNREPTFAEWAKAVEMSCQVLQSSINSGNRSQQKMINANLRLVVHLAKQYKGKGLSIHDLLQEGSVGLMKSLERFKPKAGCRFPTYAYWWIRQSIRKAIFQNSRTIRLPENVFALLKKIRDERRLCIQEGYIPTKEQLAKRVGIKVEKLETLLSSSRNPVSIQERAWLDQDVTVQEITADPEIEIPDLSISKRMMRQHLRNLLGILTPREKQIIQFRFGIYDNHQKSLSEIGDIFGLSKERVRQLETRALDKLKECLPSQGLEAYAELLV